MISTMRAALLVAAGSLAGQAACASRPGRRLGWSRSAASACAAAQAHGLSLVATCPSATQLLAGYFASELHQADCYLLYGGVGAGKSFFCREFIRAACDDEDLPVPSPTFLLQNIYDQAAGPPIHHFDLYRLTAPHDLLRLDLPCSLAGAVSLIEWPERLGGQAPEAHLAVTLRVLTPEEQARLRRQGVVPPEASGSESDPEDSTDLRWRHVCFTSAAPRWQRRLASLRAVLEARGAEFGCWVDQQEVWDAQAASKQQ